MPDLTWNILVVEDDAVIREQVRAFLDGETVAGRRVRVAVIPELPAALNILRDRKADLLVLDVYRGEPHAGGERVGLQVLESIRSTGFAPVVLYTALPEGLEPTVSKFVRLVPKDAGLEKLKREVEAVFALRVPQIHRAIVDHLDDALRHYMWDFVEKRWDDFSGIADRPEFLRLVVQRLALTLSRRGIEDLTAAVYGAAAGGVPPPEDTVHPAEYYVKPPLGGDPMLGDLRVRQKEGGPKEYRVVLWPSCDMVTTRGRTPKTDRVLCAAAEPAGDATEVQELLHAAPEKRSKAKRGAVEALCANRRAKGPDRYHFLPGVWDIPDLVVDFQSLEHLPLDVVRSMTPLASLASPFAEALGDRFRRYVGRVGTPDLVLADVVAAIERRGDEAAGIKAEASSSRSPKKP